MSGFRSFPHAGPPRRAEEVPERTIVATLCEGDYWCGAAALANSLAASGFRGALRIGCRGPVPMWARRADGRAPGGFDFALIELDTAYHLTHYKPEFLLRVAAEEMAPFDRLALIDVDAVVDAPWSRFDAWIDRAIAVCEDVNGRLPFDAPKREGWRAFFRDKKGQGPFEFGDQPQEGGGYVFPGPTGDPKEGLYANGGFIGLRRERLGFLSLWRDLIELVAPSVGGLERWSAAAPGPFHAADQDSLNVALMLTDELVEFAPASAMGFVPGEVILPHVLGPRKPWRRPFLWPSLLGRDVGLAEAAYWRYAPGTGLFGDGASLWPLLRRADLQVGRLVSALRRGGR